LAGNTGCYDSFRYSGWLCVCWPDDLQSDSGPAPGVEPGLQLFFDQLLHQGIVDVQVCVHLLQASVLLCSGLMEPDTYMRDNIVNHRGVSYDAKT
jgi:hypothetical protein